jgi:mannose/fructose/N-acetylgalactosamine-specific phosphotransferase system component IIB
VILHLDDRLLHGRILHGWGAALGVRRYVLISASLVDPARRRLAEAAAAEAGCALACAAPGDAQLPAPLSAPGDFWLTDSPETAEALLAGGTTFSELRLIGLRETGGRRVSEDVCVGERSLTGLRRLAEAGVAVAVQRFPADTPRVPVWD